MTVPELLEECKRVLERHYGSRFEGLVLFGSEARGEADPESDIDLLVLLNEPFDYWRELEQIIDVLYPLPLESDRLISALPASLVAFQSAQLPLFRNAKREGIRI